MRAPYLCVCCPGSAIFHRNEMSFGVARSYPNPYNKVASLQCSRLDVFPHMSFCSHSPLPPTYTVHLSDYDLHSQWLAKVGVGLFKVGVSRTSPHCCFREKKRPAMVPNESPCFFCCASSESLCSSSWMCKNIHEM